MNQSDLDYSLAYLDFRQKFTPLDEVCPDCGNKLYCHEGNGLKICVDC